MRKFIILYIFISFPLFSSITTRSLVSPRSAALGTGIYGNIGRNEVLHDNPAAIGFTQGYTVDGVFTNDSINGSKIFDVSVVDTRTSKVGGAFAYSRIDADEGPKHNHFYFSLADRYWNNISLALGGKYVKSNEGDQKSSFYDFDIATLYAIHQSIGLGLVMKNIRKSNEDFAPHEMSLGIQGAFSFFFPTFNITKRLRDGWGDTRKLIYATGLEVVLAGKYFLRGGYNVNNSEDRKYYAGGIGWMAPKLGLDYAYERDAKEKDRYQHLFSARFLF